MLDRLNGYADLTFGSDSHILGRISECTQGEITLEVRVDLNNAETQGVLSVTKENGEWNVYSYTLIKDEYHGVLISLFGSLLNSGNSVKLSTDLPLSCHPHFKVNDNGYLEKLPAYLERIAQQNAYLTGLQSGL